MILDVGSPDALTFTDETSLRNAGAKVFIHAQVIRERSLDWLFRLLQRAPSAEAELKSSVIVPVYFSLPDYERRRVQRTLKAVRIHITDPRSYTDSVDQYLSEVVPGGDVYAFIRRLDKAPRREAESVRRRLIARDMLWDAPPHQIKLKYLVLEHQAGLRFGTEVLEPFEDIRFDSMDLSMDFDLTPFERSNQSMENVLSPFLSKSESVFAVPMDFMDGVVEGGIYHPLVVTSQLSRSLSALHAYDTSPKEVAWIDVERMKVMAWIDRFGMFPPSPISPLSEVDSKDSYMILAADWAAGIARELWSRTNTLVHLLTNFDYVTLNGKRISESEAAAHDALLARRPLTRARSSSARSRSLPAAL